jgi:hypothetical protein
MLERHVSSIKFSCLSIVIIIFLSASVSTVAVSSAADATTWSKRYSGISEDQAYSAIQSSDGGFVVAGFARKLVVDPSDWNRDQWARLHVVKFDAYGRLLWNRFYSEDSDNRAYSIIQTSDGGYAIAGEKRAPLIKYVSGGDYDFWLIKTDSFGNMQWEKTYDEQGAHNGARSIIQTDDDGYALAGYIDSESRSLHNILVVKVNATGNLQWSKKFDEGTLAHSIVQTEDNGYAICGEKTNYNLETHQAFLVRTDSLGNKLWNKTYAEEQTWLYSMVETPDSGFALVGRQGYELFFKSRRQWEHKTEHDIFNT